MHHRMTLALTVAAVVALAACNASAAPSTAPTTGVSAGGAGAVAGQSAAANGGGGGGGAATVTDPCTLLAQADVTTAVGMSVGPGSSADNPESCDFEGGGGAVEAGINFAQGSLDDFCKDAGTNAVGLTIEPVSGVGDGACFTHVGTNRVGSSLTFAKNGRLFQTFALLSGQPTPDDTKAADTKLAQAALTHL
ncbi:MAG: hypothetical protein ACJ77B_01745 [Chloroflexota bacterium]